VLSSVGRQPGARGVESLVAHVVIACIAAPAVFALEILKGTDDGFGAVPHGPIAADQIRVDIGQYDRTAVENSGCRQVKKHGAAPQKWLEIALE
jgi:hypothetical protein